MSSTAKVKPPFEAYKGKEPYVFISYAHRDSTVVFPELVWLRSIGLNVWYDEGIYPGNEWPDEIATALRDSTYFIFFVSPRSVGSVNCRNEVYYALEQHKPFLGIYLEETAVGNINAGLSLSIGSLQAILKYLDEDAYQKKLVKVLTRTFALPLAQSYLQPSEVESVLKLAPVVPPKPAPRPPKKVVEEAPLVADPKRAFSLLRLTQSPKFRHGVLAVIGMILTAAIGAALFYFPIGDGLGRISFDLPYALRTNISTDEVRLVVMDEKSSKALKQSPDAAWDRDLHVQLIKYLTDQHAKAVLFDLIFDQPSLDPAKDVNLANALKLNGHIYLGAAERSNPGQDADEEQIIPPIPSLRHAAAGWGLLVFRPIDPDSGVRRLYTGTDDLPTTTWRLAHDLNPKLPETPDPDAHYWMNYYGPAGTMKSVGYDEVLLQPDDLPSDYFRNKIVVVGGKHAVGSLKEERDEFLTPYTRWGQPFSSGMEIHATTLLNLIRGDWLIRLNPDTELLLDILGGLLISAIISCVCAFCPFKATYAAISISIALLVFGCSLQWFFGLWFDWLIPAVVETPFALFWIVACNYTLESAKRASIRKAFSLYLSPEMADQIANSEIDLTPGGQLTEATMMFTDLQGFTALSEELKDPREIGKLLIAYFTNITEHVLKSKGTIIKYIGDAVFATWGVPVKDDDHAYKATVAAWDMYLSSQIPVHGHKLLTRIGVNTGLALCGNLGSKFRFDYTLIGDAVNLASRIEGINKYLGTNVLISESTFIKLKGRLVVRPVGKFVVVGKNEPISLYEVMGPVVTKVVQTHLDSFAQALVTFQTGDLTLARQQMEESLKLFHGEDGPCKYYLNQITKLEREGFPEDWSGAIVLDAK